MTETTELLASTLRFAVPLIFAAMGGLLCERVGIVNIGLEGMLLAGAFAAVYGSYRTDSPWVGLLAAIAASTALVLLHGLVTIHLGADQIISGTALNLLALGGTGYLLLEIYGTSGSSPQVEGFGPVDIPLLHRIPVLGEALFGQSWFVWAAPAAAVAVWWFLSHTPVGLRIRASGEAPRALEAAGVSVLPVRYLTLAGAGVLCGLGGAYLSLSMLTAFTENMTAGRGFIAIAAVIFGGWHALRVLGAALFFGLASALVIRLPQDVVAPQFLYMVPYVATILALVLFSRGNPAPAALGRAYRPGGESR